MVFPDGKTYIYYKKKDKEGSVMATTCPNAMRLRSVCWLRGV